MIWRQASHGDLAQIAPQEAQIASQDELDLALEDPETVANLPRFARTLTVEERPIAVIGAWPFWDGVATVWAVLAEESRAGAARIALCRGTRQFIEAVMHRDHLHRVQTYIDPRHDVSRWMKFLKFDLEGRMRRATRHGDDLLLYARVHDG